MFGKKLPSLQMMYLLNRMSLRNYNLFRPRKQPLLSKRDSFPHFPLGCLIAWTPSKRHVLRQKVEVPVILSLSPFRTRGQRLPVQQLLNALLAQAREANIP